MEKKQREDIIFEGLPYIYLFLGSSLTNEYNIEAFPVQLGGAD